MTVSGSRRNVDDLSNAGWARNWVAELHQGLQMAFDRLAYVAFRFFECRPGGNAPRQIGHVSRPVVLRLLEHDCKLDAHFLFSSPAAFSTDLRVPTGTSSPGWPGMVT